jgi:hypothetical protein
MAADTGRNLGQDIQNTRRARCWWLTPLVLATKEAETRRIMIQSQLGQIVHETLYLKFPTHKRKAGRVVEVIEHLPSKHEFKPQYCQKANKKTQGET